MHSRDSRGKGQLLLAAAERYAHTHFATARGLLEDYQFWQAQDAVRGLFTSLLSSKPELDRNATFDVLLFLTALSGYQATAHIEAAEMWFQKSETLHASAPLSPGERHVMHRLRCQVIRTCPFGRPDDLVA